jgi:twitching motility protein PilT
LASITELLRYLSRPEVTELAMASGKPPAVKMSGAFRAVGSAALSSDEILDMLQESGAPDVQALGEKPVQWSVQAPGLGTVVVAAAWRGDVLQARFIIPRGVGEAPPAPTSSSQSTTSPAPVPGGAAVSRPTSAASVVTTAPAATLESTLSLESFDSLDALLETARQRLASDLHVISGRPPLLRIAGDLIPVGQPLPPAVVEEMLLTRVPARLQRYLKQDGSCDFALEHPTAGRFRVNVGRQRTGIKGCLRLISREIPTLASLGLPESISKATHHHQGLIVITGPTGHGKTSTLTAIVDIINRESSLHLITVEDPIEYVHPLKRAIMSQREVGTHTRTFQSAIRGSLREDPDVVVVGELRDTETVRVALSASETGHLLIATMNTPSAAKTIDRLIDLFPPADQGQVRMSLSTGLRLIVGQRLVPTADRKHVVAAVELLTGSVALGNLIRDEKTFQIPSLQQRGKGLGIIRLDDSLAELVLAGKTTLEIARDYAETPDELPNLINLLKGGTGSDSKKPAPEARVTSKLSGLLGRKGA